MMLPGMRDPLAAGHELIVRLVAEGVAHAAVIAGEADAARAQRRVRLVSSSFSIRDMVMIGTIRLLVPRSRVGEGLGACCRRSP